jgi:hypothetical protein
MVSMPSQSSRDDANSASSEVPSDPEEGSDESSGLSLSQEKAIVALLHHPTITKAAEDAGVGERTLHRWLDEDQAFASAFRRARREAFAHAIALTQHYAPHAANTLAKIMADEGATHHARVSAAATLLKFARESIELDELVARLDALEQATEQAQNRKRISSRWG